MFPLLVFSSCTLGVVLACFACSAWRVPVGKTPLDYELCCSLSISLLLPVKRAEALQLSHLAVCAGVGSCKETTSDPVRDGSFPA